MTFHIGSRIKALRLARSMTQEQLGSRLGLSSQAISKWEGGVNMPDIQLLPELAVIFGVSIDELFAMTDEHRMERIQNQILHSRSLSEEEFHQHSRYLKECQGKEATAAKAGLLLAMLYNKHARKYQELAAPLAREALLRNPGRKDAHNAVFDAEDGVYRDWNTTNHRELIDFYKEVLEAHSEDIRNYFWLLNLLIADCRTQEARQVAQRMLSLEHSYHYELYMGYICQAECDLPAALTWWREMVNAHPDYWIVWAEYASAMAKLGRYEEALEAYKKAMPLRSKPRFTDCEDAATQICLILGDIPGAIAFQNQMLAVTMEDWTTEGEAVDSIRREIGRLQALL